MIKSKVIKNVIALYYNIMILYITYINIDGNRRNINGIKKFKIYAGY